MPVKITPEVADILSRSTIAGSILKLPEGQIERSLYVNTDKVLKALGGKWDRRAGGHKFAADPTAKVAAALENDHVVSRQQALQLFETPPALAERLCQLLDIRQDDNCLEPSAGRGRILKAMADRNPQLIIAIEIDPENGAQLETEGSQQQLIIGDFLEHDPELLRSSAIAMNPPFSRNQDIRHVRHAYKCLEPGGRLAAIVSEHGFIGNERECIEWRDWLASLGAHIERVPADAFKASGTSVSTRIVSLRRG